MSCQMDYQAKQQIIRWDADQPEFPQRFPLEPICITIGKNKITADNCDGLRFWMHCLIARSTLHQRNILLTHQFDVVDWEMVHGALWKVPRLFAIWASKQVLDIAAANGNKPWDKSNIYCPSCATERETCGHILLCNDVGRVETLLALIKQFASWMSEADTDPDLWDCIIEYAEGRGYISLLEVCDELGIDHSIG